MLIYYHNKLILSRRHRTNRDFTFVILAVLHAKKILNCFSGWVHNICCTTLLFIGEAFLMVLAGFLQLFPRLSSFLFFPLHPLSLERWISLFEFISLLLLLFLAELLLLGSNFRISEHLEIKSILTELSFFVKLLRTLFADQGIDNRVDRRTENESDDVEQCASDQNAKQYPEAGKSDMVADDLRDE